MANIFNQREDIGLRRELRKQQTDTEALLWEEIRGSKLGIRFRRQFGIGSYIVDFYAPRAQLVVEIDGSIHDLEDIRENDRQRQADIEALGMRFLRFTNDEITGNIENVLRQISVFLSQNPLLTKERAG